MLDEAQKDLPLMTGVAADTETEEARKMIERQAIGDLAHHLQQGTLNEFLTLVSIWRKNKNWGGQYYITLFQSVLCGEFYIYQRKRS